MIISGFQPLSLLDYPGVICSIIFTQGCPFRCVYCHNPELIPAEAPDAHPAVKEEEVIDHLLRRKNIVEGVCITGGEPTVHPDLPDFINKLKRLGLLVKLDTNGLNPRMIEKLIKDRQVDFFAMDLKHTWERYAEVIGINQQKVIDNCRETFRLIQDSGIPHEFRTTVYSGLHGKEELEEIASQLREGERYALQEIRYAKTLTPGLERTVPLNLEAVAEGIRTKYPSLQIEVRS
ncbi:anaerobic ribonucleoside-triphosphate reductase activating protein [Patescibacteria group bacterium]|jgi:pyruvate formate lyase activating enzyme|nr:anaerobic ribonucleoside-triphosphate reductase activating protein [Patescibacteria group bacterium]